MKPVKPIEIRLTEDGKRNILTATLENKPFQIVSDAQNPELARTTYHRNKEGRYYSPDHTEGRFYGTQQLDIIVEMQDNLKRMKKTHKDIENSDTTVLIVHGGKDEQLNFREATKYISKLKAEHLSRNHVMTEMVDMITYASKVNGIDSLDNLYLSEFAEEHKLKLVYKDLGKNGAIEIEDLTNHKLQKVNKLDIRTKDIDMIGF